MRRLQGTWQYVVSIVAVVLCGFHLYTGVFGLLPAPEQRSIHVGLALILVFALRPWRKSGEQKIGTPWWDVLLIALTLVACGNIFVNWQNYLIMRAPATPFEILCAVSLILIVLEAGRRIIGWVFPILTALLIAYTLWGHYIPGEFGHAPIRWRAVIYELYLGLDGMWGYITGFSSTFIALFIIFGSFLLTTGAGKTFIDLAMLGAGRFRGGAAKVAVLSSGFFAMLSGSPLANVATTGTFTIPMMKKLGYKPEFAGGVEAVASTGGVVTPPIMGSTAFIMAEYLGISYLKVCATAAIPAFLYYLSVFMGTHFEALRRNLVPIPKEEMPPIKSVFTLSRMVCLLLPIATLVYVLLSGYSLILVGTSACLMVLVTYFFSPPLSLRGMREKLWSIPSTFEGAAKALIGIVPMLVCANILVHLLNYSGFSVKIAKLIMTVGPSNILLSLLLTAILVMLLGSTLPVAAAYILGVTVASPILIKLGLLPLAVHMFLLYYSILAVIIPPVCGAVFLAAHIAQVNWLKTAWVALRLGPLLYLMPFIFVLNNTLIMIGSPSAILLDLSTATVGAIILVSGTMSQLVTKCKIYESLVLVASGILLLIPGVQTDLLGTILFSVILVIQLMQRKRMRTVTAQNK